MDIKTYTKQQLLAAVADRLDNMKYGEEIDPELIDFCKNKDIVIAIFEPEEEKCSSNFKLVGALNENEFEPMSNLNNNFIWKNLTLHSWRFFMQFDSAKFNVIHNGKPIKTKSIVFYKPDNQEINTPTEINTEYSKGWTYTGDK